MRHRNRNRKLGRNKGHRRALLSSLVCNLIERRRIVTTLEKAREARRIAEKMVTVGRKGSLAARRLAVSELRRSDVVAKLFDQIVPQFSGRSGGYTRIVKLGCRAGDGARKAILEWVGTAPPQPRKKKEEKKTP